MKIDYDDEFDILYLYNISKSKKNKYRESFEIGNFVFDVDKESNLVGIEIFNASKLLSEVKRMVNNKKKISAWSKVQVEAMLKEKKENVITAKYPYCKNEIEGKIIFLNRK